jgi:hypothetical protein
MVSARVALLVGVAVPLDLEAQVRAVEARRDDERVAHPEPLDDLPAHGRRPGRRHREHRRTPEPLDDLTEHQVVRAEVVAPARDAVRLVDGDQGDPGLAQPVDDLVLGELLGREEDVAGRSGGDGLPRLLELPVRPGGVDRHGAGRVRVVLDADDLVLLQGHEGGDHDDGAVECECGDLVDRGLAGAGRHEGEGVAAVEDGVDHALLGLAEFPAEDLGGTGTEFVLHPIDGARSGLVGRPETAYPGRRGASGGAGPRVLHRGTARPPASARLGRGRCLDIERPSMWRRDRA